jgi:hypothetical protein
MITDRERAEGRETSYFDFLMTSPRVRRAAVPFAQAAGIRPAQRRDAGGGKCSKLARRREAAAV